MSRMPSVSGDEKSPKIITGKELARALQREDAKAKEAALISQTSTKLMGSRANEILNRKAESKPEAQVEAPSRLRAVNFLGKEVKSERKKSREAAMAQLPQRRHGKAKEGDVPMAQKDEKDALSMQMAFNVIHAPQKMEHEAGKRLSKQVMNFNGAAPGAFDMARGEWKLNHSRLVQKDAVPEHSTAWERMKGQGKGPMAFISEEKELLKRRAIESSFDNAEEARLFVRFQSAISKPVGVRKQADASCIRDHLRVINAYMRDFVPHEMMNEMALDHLRVRKLKAHSYLFKVNEWPEGCYIFVHGSAYAESPDRRIPRRKLAVGEMICDMDLAQNRKTTFSVVCYDKSVFCMIPKDAYYKYMNTFRRNLATHSALLFLPHIGPFMDCTQRELRELAYCMGIMSIREREKINLSTDSRLFLVMEGCLKVKVVSKRRKTGTGTQSVAAGFKSKGRDVSFLNGYFDRDTVDVCRPGGVMGLYNAVGAAAENKKLPTILAEAATDCILFYITSQDLIDYAPDRCIEKLENELRYRKALYLAIHERVNEDRVDRQIKEDRVSAAALQKNGKGGPDDASGSGWGGQLGTDPESAKGVLAFPSLLEKDGKPVDPVRYREIEEGILHVAEGREKKDPLLSFGRCGGNPGAGRARAHPSFNCVVGRDHGKPPEAATQTMSAGEIGFAKASNHLKFKVNDLGQITIHDQSSAMEDIERDAAIKQQMRNKLATLVDGESRSVDHIVHQSNIINLKVQNSGNHYYMDELAEDVLSSAQPTHMLDTVKTFRPAYTKGVLEKLDEEQFDPADDLSKYLTRTELQHLSVSPRKVGLKQSTAPLLPHRDVGFSSTFVRDGMKGLAGEKVLTPRLPVGFDAGGRRTKEPLKRVYSHKFLGKSSNNAYKSMLNLEDMEDLDAKRLDEAKDRLVSPTGIRMPAPLRRSSPTRFRRTVRKDKGKGAARDEDSMSEDSSSFDDDDAGL